MFGRFSPKMGGSGHFRATLPLLLHGNQKKFNRESCRGDTDELESKKNFGYLLQLFPEVNFSVFLNFWGKPHCNPVGGGRGKKTFFQYFPIFSIHSDPNKNGFGPFINGTLGFRKEIVVTSYQFWDIDMAFLPSQPMILKIAFFTIFAISSLSIY